MFTQYHISRLLVVAVFFIATAVHAQLHGAYQFEDLTAPQANISGTWFITDDTLASSVSGSYIEFDVDNTVNQMLITTIQNASGTYGFYRVCSINCENASRSTAVNVSGTVTITKSDNITSQFDYLQLIPAVMTPTPNPSIVMSDISGTNTEFHMIVTAGDVAISSALLFLLFTLVTGGLLFIIFGDSDVW